MPYEVFFGSFGLSLVFLTLWQEIIKFTFFLTGYFFTADNLSTLYYCIWICYLKEKKLTFNWFKGVYCLATTRRAVTYEGCGEEMILLSLSPSPPHYHMPKCKEVQRFKLSHIPPSSLLVMAGQYTWLSK